jgi:hypothetical protein
MLASTYCVPFRTRVCSSSIRVHNITMNHVYILFVYRSRPDSMLPLELIFALRMQDYH